MRYGEHVYCLLFVGSSVIVSSLSSFISISNLRDRSSAALVAKSAHGWTIQEDAGNSGKTVVVAGATGYIGRAVVAESVKRGYHTVALVRSKAKLENAEGVAAYRDAFSGATVMECNVQNPDELNHLMASMEIPVDTVISCLASPIGHEKGSIRH